MNDDEILENHRRAVDAGAQALQAGNRDQAGQRFYDALEALDDVGSDVERRDALAPFALYLQRLQFLDLARLAVCDALELDRKLKDDDAQSQDLLTLANVEANTGDLDKARGLYEQSIEMCLALGRLSNAASGTTNLAILVGQDDIPEAIRLLRQSLDYLREQPFPDTEITTRLALLQALVVDDRAADEVAAETEALYVKFRDVLRPDQVHNSIQPMVQSLRRALAGEPGADVDAWLADHLPAAADLMRTALDAAD